jgi:hypothetical protein
MRMLRAAALLAVLLAPASAPAQNSPGSRSPGTAGQDRAIEQWNAMKLKDPSAADAVIRDQLANPMGSALPEIPKTGAGNIGRAFGDWVREQLSDKVVEEILAHEKSMKPGLVESFQNNVDRMLNYTPGWKPAPDAKTLLDRQRMIEDYGAGNIALCAPVPPLVCQSLGNGRVECAGGPRVSRPDRPPPWEYTVRSRCEGTRFVSLETFGGAKTTQTEIAPRREPDGSLTYNGAPYAGFCQPCPASAKPKVPSPPKPGGGGIFICLFGNCPR